MNDEHPTGNAIVVLLVTVDEGGRATLELHQAGTLDPHQVAGLLRQAASQIDPPRIILPENGAGHA